MNIQKPVTKTSELSPRCRLCPRLTTGASRAPLNLAKIFRIGFLRTTQISRREKICRQISNAQNADHQLNLPRRSPAKNPGKTRNAECA